jgi:hypothetical protein
MQPDSVDELRLVVWPGKNASGLKARSCIAFSYQGSKEDESGCSAKADLSNRDAILPPSTSAMTISSRIGSRKRFDKVRGLQIIVDHINTPARFGRAGARSSTGSEKVAFLRKEILNQLFTAVA